MTGVWRWEAYDPAGVRQVADTLDGIWWELTPQAAADHGLALLLARVHPDYPRLAGWPAGGCGPGPTAARAGLTSTGGWRSAWTRRTPHSRGGGMAWEDRTPEQKAAARRAARARAKTDDNRLYVVTTDSGTQLIAKGINSAKVLAGEDGTYRRKTD